MALFQVSNIEVSGISAAVPRNTVSNSGLEGYTKDELEKLIATLGIHERRVADSKICASDLCIESANKLIEKLNWKKSEIEVLFFVSQTPDYILPGSSLNIVERLGLPKSCVSFDINQGCAGYVYGLSLISSFMSASKLSKGLLLVGDTITKFISPNNKSLVPIFSDCGTATALSYNSNSSKISFNISSEGIDYDAIIVEQGGSRSQFKTDANGKLELNMKGLEVFNFSLKKVAPNIQELLVKEEQSVDDIDYFILHQANALILESIAQKINVDMAKVPSSLMHYGNTSGATIPLTIVTNLNKGGEIINSKNVLAGFGVGLSLASAIVEFNNVVCCDLIEV